MALLMVVASDFVFESTMENVDYGDFEGVSDLLFRGSINGLEQCGCFKLLMRKSYEEGTDPKYMEGIYSGLGDAVKRAETGGRSMKRSTYDDDFPCLMDLNKGIEDINENIFQIYCYDREEDEETEVDGEDAEEHAEENAEEHDDDDVIHNI